MELANGAEGYIPPPAQHQFGGYTTWPARTAGLETTAEPKIAEAVLRLLEKVAGQPRRQPADRDTTYTRAVLSSTPLAYRRMGEFAGAEAADTLGKHSATYEGRVAFYLPGPALSGVPGRGLNRAPYFAGGRLTAAVELNAGYPIERWFWNGLPAEARSVTGTVFSLGSDELSLTGGSGPARLRFGNTRLGGTPIELRKWTYVAVARDGTAVRVYVNGAPQPDIEADVARSPAARLFVAGRPGEPYSFEGQIDEVAVYARSLPVEELRQHYRSSARNLPSPKRTIE
jgi:hypothetical protein